jgi:hypothetical protein
MEVHCDRARPTLIMLARTSGMVQPRAHIFGIRFNLETHVGTVFSPLVSDEASTDSIMMLHPFLLGYSGTIDRSLQSSGKAFYVVAHGWDGGGIFSTYGTAWCSETGF